jgi:hypothetical protein
MQPQQLSNARTAQPAQARGRADGPREGSGASTVARVSLLDLQATAGNQAVQRLVAGSNTVVQRTLQDAVSYARRDRDLSVYTIANRQDVEAVLVDQSVPVSKRETLKERYNRGLPDHQQISLKVAAGAVVANTANVDDTTYWTFWSAGMFGDQQANADGHFDKHVLKQGEFSGEFQNVVDYTAAAWAFGQVNDDTVLQDVQKGGNLAKYRYDVQAQRGRMVVLNGQNGRLTSFYELRGKPLDTAEYVRDKLGLASAQEVLMKFKQLKTNESAQLMPEPQMGMPQPVPTQASPWLAQPVGWAHLQDQAMDEAFMRAPSGFFTLPALNRYFPTDVVTVVWSDDAEKRLRGVQFVDRVGRKWHLISSSYPHQVALARS